MNFLVENITVHMVEEIKGEEENLVGELHLPTSKSANIVTNFMGTINLFGHLGGFLANAKLGRYFTVAIFASIAQ